MTDNRRLIEVAFPLKQASLDSVHEKNVRHGHISTLHIWPARRPLAACRAALIATLLPDPGNPEDRKRLLEKIGGTVVQKVEKKKVGGKTVEVVRDETVGGILHWGRESNPDIQWFRQEIRKAYGGRPPSVLDPFAGGGAIPLEAMRLGCEATASDINPVACSILKCTLEYPQKFAGQHRPLPPFALESPEFMEAFFKGTGKLTKKQLERNLDAVQKKLFPAPDVDLAWHVRAWGWWVLREARKRLAGFYPTYAQCQPLTGVKDEPPGQQTKRVPLKSDGTWDLEALNGEFSHDYLSYPHNPRWIPKPTVAYLWARTVTCKNCRAAIPLLKMRWLCKKHNERVVLTMTPNQDNSGVRFGVERNVPQFGINAAQRREHDKRTSVGTMSRSGATCPCCGKVGQATMTMKDIQLEGRAGRLGTLLTAVVVAGPDKKEYRTATGEEVQIPTEAETTLDAIYSDVPHGRPFEPIAPASTRSISCDLYGIDNFSKAFTHRQQAALGEFVRISRSVRAELPGYGYGENWQTAIRDYLFLAIDRLADRSSVFCRWDIGRNTVNNTFSRFSLPMLWDFCESNPLSNVTGGYRGAVEWIAEVIEHCMSAEQSAPPSKVEHRSAAVKGCCAQPDVIMTDPPYYQAISYADLSDFFYIWQKRLQDSSEFSSFLTLKEGEIVQHVRSDKNRAQEKEKYESGMYQAFCRAYEILHESGRFVVVFAHKDPGAWETLVSAMIRGGFVVTASWPIQTEMGNRGRAQSSAALASSVWLVCKKRPESARPGWDNKVLDEMREKIYSRLHEFWDAGIRGPDFVWSGTGPALEAYSKYPIVKKANEPGEIMEVSEFLRNVRRIVVDFVVGRVLSHNEATEAVIGLDDITTYYLLHRYDFGMEDAPSGACILYAISCGLADSDLTDQSDLLIRTGGQAIEEEEEELSGSETEDEVEEGTGSKVKLKPWQQRRNKSLGLEASGSRAVPLIDQVHRLMHLWKAGDQVKVDEYLDARALRKNVLFHPLLQALIELAKENTEERSLLESISNHLIARGVAPEQPQGVLPHTATRSEADDTE